MRVAAFTVAMLLATPAFAKDITLTLTDADQKVLVGLLDNALKSGGIANLQAVTAFIQKIQAASGPVVPVPPGATTAPAPDPKAKPEDKPKE